ncbi:MAG: energy transducer TonB [Bacteroidota bacterium]|nr:energy transducer TonB [Bacteroidota bacterium]MDP4195211.1 energy transducer TonB [Bacteroidota bacterium]
MKSKYRYLIAISIVVLVFIMGFVSAFIMIKHPFSKFSSMKEHETYITCDWARSYYSISLPKDYYDRRFLNQTSQIVIGDKKFLDIINKSIPVKTVFDNCGEGMHDFYFIFQVDKNGNAIDCNIRKIINTPDDSDIKNADYLIKGKTLISNLAAKYQPGVYRGRNVNSLLVKELVIYVDKSGNSRTGWNFSEKLPGISMRPYNYGLRTPRGFHQKRELEEYKSSVDKFPGYPGGTLAMAKFIERNIIYPEAAKLAGVEGKVIVEVYIDEIGRVTYARILKGIGGGCEAEAERVLGLLKNFHPGIENGVPVKTKIVIPFNFNIG